MNGIITYSSTQLAKMVLHLTFKMVTGTVSGMRQLGNYHLLRGCLTTGLLAFLKELRRMSFKVT